MSEKLLTVEQVAEEHLNCSVPMVYKLAAAREIGSVRVGKALRFKPEHVAAYLATHEVPART